MICKRWTARDETILALLVSQRMPAREIAMELGRSIAAVQNRMSKLGLESQCPKGNHRRISRGAAKGGVVTLRLPRRMHKQFSEVCQTQRKSMNEFLIEMIGRAIAEIQRKTHD